MIKSCCEKVEVLRERIEAHAKMLDNVLTYLKELKDEECDHDEFTLNLLIGQIEDQEYINDVKLPENMVCEHGRK